MAKSNDKNTESKILNAAKNVFQSKGMDGSRMQEIADSAGINKALLHYYYRSKQVLFEAVFSNAFSLIAPQLNKILNDDTDLFEKIRNFAKNYISFIQKHPYLPNFVINELNRNPEFVIKLKEKKDFPKLENFTNQINEYVAQGLIRPISPEQLFMNLLSLNLFPVIGAPLFKMFLNLDDAEYKKIMEDRKTEVADFIINAIKIN